MGAVLTLLKRSEDVGTVALCARMLSSLLACNASQAAALAAGGLPEVAEFLQHTDATVLEPAIKALHQLVSKPSNLPAAAAAVPPALLAPLLDHADQAVAQHAAACLVYMSG